MTDLRGSASSNRTARILIVDDDPDQCTLLETVLRRSGHTTVAVGDPSSAIDTLADDVFDIALVDIGLEGMSGHDLCERVRGKKPDTVVILITGNGTIQAAMTALPAGTFDLLVTPLEDRLVDLAIQRALKHRALNVEVGLIRCRSA